MKLIHLLVLALLAMVIAGGCAPAAQPEAEEATVRLRVRTHDGDLLDDTAPLRDGDTALSILQQYCKDNQVQMETNAIGYVTGIDNLYEGDQGEMSGWLVRVNDTFLAVAAGEYELSENDDVEWLYSLDWGMDWGMDWGE